MLEKKLNYWNKIYAKNMPLKNNLLIQYIIIFKKYLTF